MKFELSDNKNKISDSDLLNDLIQVANNVGKNSLKVSDYAKTNGAKYVSLTLKKRFGSWEQALKKAGLHTEKSIHGIEYGESGLREEIILDDIKRVSRELNNPKLTIKEYLKYGKYGGNTIQRRFGGWINATKKAGLFVERSYRTTTYELFQNILEMWTKLGRQPKYNEVVRPFSKFSTNIYENRFGTWNNSLIEFVKWMNSESTIEQEENNQQKLIKITGQTKVEQKKEKIISVRRTRREINLRLRYAVLKRDNFSCKKCGNSPAKDSKVILHIDHIIPWSKGGETVIENLETLCQNCNLGKSNVF